MKNSDFTILFAEDNLEAQKMYQRYFVQEGFHVLIAEHGARVMAELKDQKVDLLVTDLEMPGMNTLDLFPILKKDHPRLPVIVVSGHYKDLKDDFLNKGFNVRVFLSKPVSMSALKKNIMEILKNTKKT